MSPILVLSILLQIACCVHVVRSGRPLYWMLFLMMFSYLAVLVYVVAAVIPDLRAGPSGQRAMRKVRNQLDPGRGARAASRQLQVADTPENRRRLAEESLRTGDFASAEVAYRGALKGLYADDPDLMLGLAQAQHGLGQPADALQTLQSMWSANPNYRSHEADLLHARVLADTGALEEALQRFDSVARGYPGEEARVRYGQLLRQGGHNTQAAEQFRESLQRSQTAPGYYKREQKTWLDIAKRELAAIGG
ncbi:tetratricopeptide repeat protein [Pseudoxanthomonas sp.]|uniref:tetratricopeptide repeat protein n=1 Tax=Pseudoxanthomonas sp. TaxID=1871049 RepID=UPI00260585AA|nr:tetratricopeptide repeat protein [Pseudoxanthomonas sp.]WDS37273.1 MAG: tetratricopeptide repeat protein [Pseudoxanthomonas sp.]